MLFGMPMNRDTAILQDAYAAAYDSHNSLMVAPFAMTSPEEIRQRFSGLKYLARKYAPGKLRTVERIERMALDNHSGRITDRSYIHGLRAICLGNGVNMTALDQAEARINALDGLAAGPPGTMGGLMGMFRRSGEMLERGNRRPARRMECRPQRPMSPRDLIRSMFGGVC
jgi:hypothetical protein